MLKQENEKGNILVTVAILIVVLVAFVALGTDIGMLHSARAAAQRAADAAALAGAYTFVVDNSASQPGTATTHATNVATSNSVFGDAITSGQVAVSVDVANRRVTVTITRAQNTFFARVLGENSANITVTAIAEASLNATGSKCIKPWFIPNTIVDDTNTPCAACTAGHVLLSGGQITAYAQGRLGVQIRLKPGDPSQALGPGVFSAINLDPNEDTGGADYRNNIGACKPGAVYCNQLYNVKTGNMIGPTKQGVCDLICPGGNGNCNSCTADVYVGIGQYQRADGTITDTSKQLVVAPVWDTCSVAGFCPTNNFPNGGNTNLQIIGFALIFLDGVQGNDVLGRIINVTSCTGPGGGGGGGGGIQPPETGPFAIPVRLVRTS